MIRVLDLFSAAAGGWSLGMHRAGFTTMAACEFVDWRRALYSQNNPGVPVYDDVRTLTADRLVRDGHGLPDVIVGSPPCQDISSANTKGKGVEGERSGLYFDAVRLVGECRPRWFAFENSSNLRTRGADAVLAALEALGYACWTFVVRAGDIGANHERPRCWIIGCDITQVTNAAEAGHAGRPSLRRGRQTWHQHARDHAPESARRVGTAGEPAYAGQERQEDGALVLSLFPSSIAEAGCADGWGDEARIHADPTEKRPQGQPWSDERREGEIAERANLPARSEVGICQGDRLDLECRRAGWSLDDLARHLQLDDGLSSWVAGTRVAVGGPKGTSAASLIVEAFGDAVVPQIPEAIGLAILRTERALAEVYGRIAA